MCTYWPTYTYTGTAFIKFKERASAEKAVSAGGNDGSEGKKSKVVASDAGGVVVDGRSLNISFAVNRNEANRLLDANKKKKEDKRHLYLGECRTYQYNIHIYDIYVYM
jgi:hypothetical protein